MTKDGSNQKSSASELESQAAAVIDRFTTYLRSEVRTTLLLRLIPLIIIYGTLTAGAMLVEPYPNAAFSGSWLLVAGVQCLLIWLLSIRSSYFGLFTLAFCSAAMCLNWWFLLPLFRVGHPYLWVLLLVFTITGFGFMPWPLRYNVTLACLYSVVALVVATWTGYFVITGGLAAMLILVALDFSAENYVTVVARSAHAFLGGVCASASASVSATLRVMGVQLAYMADSENVLIAWGPEEAEVITKGEIRQATAFPLQLKGLCQAAHDVSAEQGVIRRRNLGPGYQRALRDWFGFVPGRILFANFATVLSEREQHVTVFVPYASNFYLIGRRKIWSIFCGLVSLARITVGSARARFVSSDALLASEQTLARRDQEISQVVHVTNNVAQEICAISDELKRAAPEGVSDGAALPRERLFSALKGMESAARALALDVSDIKLLVEMQRIKVMGRYEKVALAPLLEDLENYNAYQVKRGFSVLEIKNSCDADMAAKVVSQEFLEAALRAMVRLVSLKAAASAPVTLAVTREDQSVNFSVSGPRAAVDDATWQRLQQGWAGANEAGLAEVSALSNFAALCRGTFIRLGPEAPHLSAFALKLPLTSLTAGSRIEGRSWVLFVDDNPQVVSFYSRAAEALNIPFVAATSYSQAKKLLEERGAPGLLVTDLQLGDGSGLELLRQAKAQHGAGFRSILVSGYSDDGIKAQAQLAGASVVLRKPVSRARLFAEIEQMVETGKVEDGTR